MFHQDDDYMIIYIYIFVDNYYNGDLYASLKSTATPKKSKWTPEEDEKYVIELLNQLYAAAEAGKSETEIAAIQIYHSSTFANCDKFAFTEL